MIPPGIIVALDRAPQGPATASLAWRAWCRYGSRAVFEQGGKRTALLRLLTDPDSIPTCDDVGSGRVAGDRGPARNGLDRNVVVSRGPEVHRAPLVIGCRLEADHGRVFDDDTIARLADDHVGSADARCDALEVLEGRGSARPGQGPVGSGGGLRPCFGLPCTAG